MLIATKNNNNALIADYEKAVRNLAMNRDSLVFGNKGARHAAIVISTILDNSRDIVRIFANNMNGEISNLGGYYQSLTNFTTTGKRLLIVLDGLSDLGTPPKVENFSQTLRFIYEESLRNNNIKLKFANEEFINTFTRISPKKDMLYHFTVGDESMVRLETDNKLHEAPLCSFNNPRVARYLIDLFDNSFESCETISFH